MKIISKIKIHLFFYLFSIIFIFNGLFREYIYIMLIVLIHELGHILMGIYYKFNIEKIIILPFGALTIFNTLINIELKKELFVTLMGPLFQIPLFLINNEKFIYYNKIILLFNLLPIFPLDGSKIFNIILNKFFSYKKSNKLSIFVSIILIIYLFKLNKSLMSILIIILLLKKVIESILNYKSMNNKFLLERYLYKFNFKKTKIINNIDHMKRDYKHLFYDNNEYKTEDTIIKEMFDK